MTIFRRLGLLAPLAALSLAGCGLNSVPTAEEKVNAEFGNLQAEYQRRNDLIGNLVETVKGAAGSESQILIQVTQARSRATSVNLTPEQLDDPQAVRARFEVNLPGPHRQPCPPRAACLAPTSTRIIRSCRARAGSPT